MQERKFENIFTDMPLNNGKVAICITTNGVVKKDGHAVMGAGIAKQAKDIFSGIDNKLGDYLLKYGNRCFNLGKYEVEDTDCYIFSFPTKQHYKDNADINLIENSCKQLLLMLDKFGINKVYIPYPGIGCGKLNKKDVEKILNKYFKEDNRVIVFEKGIEELAAFNKTLQVLD